MIRFIVRRSVDGLAMIQVFKRFIPGRRKFVLGHHELVPQHCELLLTNGPGRAQVRRWPDNCLGGDCEFGVWGEV